MRHYPGARRSRVSVRVWAPSAPVSTGWGYVATAWATADLEALACGPREAPVRDEREAGWAALSIVPEKPTTLSMVPVLARRMPASGSPTKRAAQRAGLPHDREAPFDRCELGLGGEADHREPARRTSHAVVGCQPRAVVQGHAARGNAGGREGPGDHAVARGRGSRVRTWIAQLAGQHLGGVVVAVAQHLLDHRADGWRIDVRDLRARRPAR